jgi:hypothetical protein
MLSPAWWWPGDLDFLCGLGKLMAVLTFFLSQGYVEVSRRVKYGDSVVESPEDATENAYYNSDVLDTIVVLSKPGWGCKINVLESSLPCAEAPVFFFHSTLVMNVLTAKGVICFYPQWTLRNCGTQA